MLPVPLLVWRLLRAVKTQPADKALKVPFWERLQPFFAYQGAGGGFLKRLLLILGWIGIVTAAARPVWLGQPLSINPKARNIMLVIDTSGSMQQQDFDINNQPVSRMNLVKNLVNDFIEKRTGDNIGMVIFGSEAYSFYPLSLDRKTLQALFSEVDSGIAGDLTAIGDALALGVHDVERVPATSLIVILLSDGTSNAGEISVTTATELAQQKNIKVYTIGVGSAPKAVQNFFGMRQLVNPAQDLDENTLQQIATVTGGRYFRAKTATELKEIYETINKLEKTDSIEWNIRPRKELFYFPALLALLCLLLIGGMRK